MSNVNISTSDAAERSFHLLLDAVIALYAEAKQIPEGVAASLASAHCFDRAKEMHRNISLQKGAA